MKKVSIKFLAGVVVLLTLICMIAGFVIAYVGKARYIVSAGITFGCIILFFMCCLLPAFFETITDRFVANTLKTNSEKENFTDYCTFYSNLSTIRIEESTGRIAYVSNFNPFEFQVISAKDIEHIKSDYMKGPFGGTRYVYFEFWYKSKQYRMPTFTSRNMYSLESSEVLEGISKADAYAETLEHAKANAVSA